MRRHYSVKQQYVTTLNGTDQYWSKTTPVNMGLNGSEAIAAVDDRTFETTVGNWANGGNHTIARSITYQKSGVASGLIAASAAGDSTTNYASLPITAFATLTSGCKYTFELWAYGDAVGVTLAITIGDQTVTGKAVYSAVAGTFSKVVFNFQATASTVGQPIQLYLSGAGNCYIDDVSLTQAYDGVIVCNAKVVDNADYYTLFHDDITFYTYIVVPAAGTLRSIVTSTTAFGYTGTTNILTLGNFLFTLVINRTGNLTMYLNNVIEGTPVSLANCGKLASPSTFKVGGYTNPAEGWYGTIGNFQFIRFNSLPTDIVSTIAYINATWKRNGLPRAYLGGQVTLDIDWSKRGLDKSSSGNLLVPAGSATTTRIRY